MGKHVKKKSDSSRLPRRREVEENYVADTWLDAAAREGELDDLTLDDAMLFDDPLPLPEETLGGDRVEETLVVPEEEIPPESEEEILPEIQLPETESLPEPETEILPETEPDFFAAPAPETAPEAETFRPEEPLSAEAVPAPPEKPAPPKAPRPVKPAQARASRPEKGAPGQTSGKKKARPSSARSAEAAKKRKRKRRARKFKKGLRVYVIIMLCLIVGICAVLWVFLSRYQRGVDQRSEAERLAAEQAAAERAEAEAIRRAPQRCFEAWAAAADSDYWTERWFETHPLELESRDLVRSFMQKRFSAATPYRAAEYRDDAPVYVLRDGDDSLARIYLSGAGQDWSVSQVDLLVTGDKSASVNAITGSKIFCNGIELGQEYVTDTAVSFSYAPLSDRLVNPVSMLTYTVDGLLAEPVLTAEPPEGCNLVQTEDGGFLLCMSQAEGQPLADNAVNFVRAYLYYFMSGLNNTYGNLSYALSFLTPNTQAYSDLQDTLNGVIWNSAYSNIDTSDTVASDVVIWADNCRSVDVRYSAKATLNGVPQDYADATMRIYFLQGNNGNFYISNFENL